MKYLTYKIIENMYARSTYFARYYYIKFQSGTSLKQYNIILGLNMCLLYFNYLEQRFPTFLVVQTTNFCKKIEVH